MIEAKEAARNALDCVFDAIRGEQLLILCDEDRLELARAFADGALELGLLVKIVTLKTTTVRTKIDENLRLELTLQKPDIYLNLMRGIREETPFRIEIIKLQTRGKVARLAHCPGITLEMLTEGSLALSREEHLKMQSLASRSLQALVSANEVKLTSPSGTDLKVSVRGRRWFTDVKFDWELWKWINLPTGEVIVAPIESSLEGRLVCDLAVGGIGVIRTLVEITAKHGKVQSVSCRDRALADKIKDTLATDDWSNVIGELAFSINPKAKLEGEFLEAEKIRGTAHIAFGNNDDYPGGMNRSRNHMDFLMSKPTLEVGLEDGTKITLLKDGRFLI